MTYKIASCYTPENFLIQSLHSSKRAQPRGPVHVNERPHCKQRVFLIIVIVKPSLMFAGRVIPPRYIQIYTCIYSLSIAPGEIFHFFFAGLLPRPRAGSLRPSPSGRGHHSAPPPCVPAPVRNGPGRTANACHAVQLAERAASPPRFQFGRTEPPGSALPSRSSGPAVGPRSRVHLRINY